MAIRLASAIGEQRENVDVFGGLAGIISKTGDALQAQREEKRREAEKKADQEQKLKDAIAASTDFTPLVNVHPNDREKDLQFKQKEYNAIMVAAADPKVTRSQLEKMQRDYISAAQDNKYVMERDWEAIQSVAGKQDDYDTQRFDNLLMEGHTDPTTTAEMPNDDFMAASEMNKAGTVPSENLPSGQGALQNLPNDPNVQGELILLPNDPNFQGKLEELSKNPNLRGIQQSDGSVRVINKGGQNVSEGNKMNEMKRTETTTSFQGVPYLDRPISERKMVNTTQLANELTTLKRPNILLASKGYFGQNHKFDGYTKATTKISPTTGEIIYDFDEEGADLDARKFASSMIGDGNFGDKSHKQYQRALEYEAMDKGTEAGLSGEKLKNFVQESVAKVAYDDFMRNARAAEMDRIKNDRQVTKAPSKGGGFSIAIGGGGAETPDGVFIPKETPLMSDDEFESAYNSKKEQSFKTWEKNYTDKYPQTEKSTEDLKSMYNAELSKKSKNDPNLTIGEWNKKQARNKEYNAKKGLTAISFTPKGTNNWFAAKTTDGKTRKIIPTTIYKNNNGELVKVEGYNVDESTDKVKIDLEEFEVDTKNAKNRDSFIGRYPTSIKAAEINIPTKVVVSGKQGVGTIQGKGAAPKAAAANVSMSDEDKQAMDWANANPSDARAKAIKEKLKKKGLIK
jgi:hypothetical protein